MKQIYGVNLGGWLVVEKWMTPSLFKDTDAIDERTLSQLPVGQDRLRRHRQEFIKEADIRWLAKRGVELVRMPVGYWLFQPSSPYLSGTAELDACMDWCDKYDIKVIIDLHGAPGSQNGNDHSGQSGGINLWNTPGNQDLTIKILEKIAFRYGKSPALWGIELLNEPHVGDNYFKLRKFYKRAYDSLDKLLPKDIRIIFADGFRPRLMNGALARRPRVVMDTHHYQFATKYQIFSRFSLRKYGWRLSRRRRLINRLVRTQPVMVGEWSAVLGHELIDHEQISDETYRNKWLAWHIEKQYQTFARAEVICYWSYKIESPTLKSDRYPWSFRFLVEQGIIKLPAKEK